MSNYLDALQLLKSHDILALAVYGEKGHWIGAGESHVETADRQYIAIVSLLDIAIYLT